MPDLVSVLFAHCVSAERAKYEVAGSGGKTYTLTFRHNTLIDCTCPSFQFSSPRKTCKHIENFDKSEHCGWMQFTDGGEPTEDKKCPKCGKDVAYMYWGV